MYFPCLQNMQPPVVTAEKLEQDLALAGINSEFLLLSATAIAIH